jgi:hypothetical protein
MQDALQSKRPALKPPAPPTLAESRAPNPHPRNPTQPLRRQLAILQVNASLTLPLTNPGEFV